MQTPNPNAPGAAASSASGTIPNAQRNENVASAAHTAPDAVGTAASYVRGNDLKSMLSNFQRVVKNFPGTALLSAAALGFLIARAFSRRRREAPSR